MALGQNKILMFVVLSFSLFMAGCIDGPDERIEMSLEHCRRIIIAPWYSESAKLKAQKVIDNWNNGQIDSGPVLITALYKCTKNGKYILSIYMADEDFDIQGFGVKEKHYTDSGVEILEEKYPLFVHYSCGLQDDYILFTPRISKFYKKYDNGWDYFVSEWQDAREGNPTIYLSLPEEGEVETELYIYDSKGNVSDSVFLELHPKTNRDSHLLNSSHDRKGLQ